MFEKFDAGQNVGTIEGHDLLVERFRSWHSEFKSCQGRELLRSEYLQIL